MKYNRLYIDKLLRDYSEALPDNIREAANILKSRGRKCIFIDTERMEGIIELQSKINAAKPKSN